MLTKKWKNIIERFRVAAQGGDRVNLSHILAGSTHVQLSAEEKIYWIEQLVQWVRFAKGKSKLDARLRFLFQVLDQNPKWKESSAKLIASVLQSASCVRLFTDTGVPSSNVFMKEASTRFIRGLLPEECDARSLDSVLAQAFHGGEDIEFLLLLGDSHYDALIRWLSPAIPEDFRKRLFQDAFEACFILTARTMGIALRRDMLERTDSGRGKDNPVLALLDAVKAFEKDFWQTDTSAPIPESSDLYRSYRDCIRLLGASLNYFENVVQHMEQQGVSVDLVFQIERASAYLDRISVLCRLLFKSGDKDFSLLVRRFFLELIKGEEHDRNITFLVQENFRLLAKKIVERTGKVGEDYITRSRSEYWHMFYMAFGGGVVAAGIVMMKYMAPPMPPFFDALYATFSYASGFLLMHLLHFKLATKQPSMTASALAEKVSEENTQSFIQEVAWISSSQFAAFLGNILAVIPAVVLLDFLYTKWLGTSFHSPSKAVYVMDSVHPIYTLSIFYGALTGVLLWLSALLAGWVENAYVLFRVPQALKSHRFLRIFLGKDRLSRWVESFSNNISGVSGAISLGVLLGFVPVLGKFFGLPLEVRHVTMTTGTVTFAIYALGPSAIGASTWLAVILGLGIIGVLNFGVSFLLAFLIAVRAKNIGVKRAFCLLRDCAREFLRSPLRFLIVRE